MKITKLELKNFRRFTDLTIDLSVLATAPKLVLLIGANGSGKSSVFDAFEALNKISKNDGEESYNSVYYKKNHDQQFVVNATTNRQNGSGKFIQSLIISGSTASGIGPSAFYGRSSIRQVSKLTRTAFGQVSVSFEQDSDRPRTFIDRDNRFENDIEKTTTDILREFYTTDVSSVKIRDSYIDPINRALDNIFSFENAIQLKLISITPPIDGKTAEIIFEKGTSQIPYNYLSSGEKEIFNILLNLLTRKAYFTDTIYFLDEIDLHLNTQLQKGLLKEITENWIPDNCQLWTASHSLGFIEYANEAEHAAIIDLDNLNFDLPQTLKPSPKTNFDVFEIAVSKEFLSKVFEGKKIIFSENTDTALYNNLNIAGTVFFNAVDKLDVFLKSKNNPSYFGLIDRDYLTDDERIDLTMHYQGLYILDYYSIENYLFHPDNLEEYYSLKNKPFDKPDYKAAIEGVKKTIRDRMLMGIAKARDGYPFYKDNQDAEKLKAFRMSERGETLVAMFDSSDFDIFYKVFPAKDFGTQIPERQNLNKIDLAKTDWFKTKIQSVLNK